MGLPKITFRGGKFVTQVYTSFRQNSICGSDVINISYLTFDIRYLIDLIFVVSYIRYSLRDKFDICYCSSAHRIFSTISTKKKRSTHHHNKSNLPARSVPLYLFLLSIPPFPIIDVHPTNPTNAFLLALANYLRDEDASNSVLRGAWLTRYPADIRNRSRRLADRNPPRSNIETNESRTGKTVEDKLESTRDDYGSVIVQLPTVIILYYFL